MLSVKVQQQKLFIYQDPLIPKVQIINLGMHGKSTSLRQWKSALTTVTK